MACPKLCVHIIHAYTYMYTSYPWNHGCLEFQMREAQICVEDLIFMTLQTKRRIRLHLKPFHTLIKVRPVSGLQAQESKKNSLKDFVHVAGPLGVTHFMCVPPPACFVFCGSHQRCFVARTTARSAGGSRDCKFHVLLVVSIVRCIYCKRHTTAL